MKLIRTVYSDQYNNEWSVEFHELPKRRGTWKFWTAECNNLEFRGDSKTELFRQIADTVKSNLNENGLTDTKRVIASEER